jgi:uncharacterized protein involved in exopolysaccharide biosynthesis
MLRQVKSAMSPFITVILMLGIAVSLRLGLFLAALR